MTSRTSRLFFKLKKNKKDKKPSVRNVTVVTFQFVTPHPTSTLKNILKKKKKRELSFIIHPRRYCLKE